MFYFCRALFLFLLVSFGSVFAGQKAMLFNDTSTWYHWGCTGTSLALKEGIEKAGFTLRTVPIYMVKLLKNVPAVEEFDDPEKFEQFCKHNKEFVQAMQEVDAILITGEGTMHGLHDGPKALLYIAHISKVFLGKHVEILNHSAYPYTDPKFAYLWQHKAPKPPSITAEAQKQFEQKLKISQAVYQKIYANLDFVAIREPISQDQMQQLGIYATLGFDCLPLYIRDHYTKEKKIEENTLVISGGVCHKAGDQHICRYIESMAERGFKIKVLIGAAAFPARDDRSFVEFLHTHCKADFDVIEATTMEQWLETIQSAQLLVSGRFHFSIAAYCLNTPFIALNSNTPKVHGICALLGLQEPLLFSDPQLLEQLITRTEAILSEPEADHQQQIEMLQELAEKNFDGLRALAKKPSRRGIPKAVECQLHQMKN